MRACSWRLLNEVAGKAESGKWDKEMFVMIMLGEMRASVSLCSGNEALFWSGMLALAHVTRLGTTDSTGHRGPPELI
jgi:hypothetical protein